MTTPYAYDGVNEVPRNATDVIIASHVTAIGKWDFARCSSLTTVVIPPSIITIEEGAFYDCTSLSTITIPSSITTIGEKAFRNCVSLTTITLPPSITTIEEGTFAGCTSLSNIKLPPSITAIKSRAFYRCRSLSTIKLPPRLTSIEYITFHGCSNLTAVDVHPSLPFLFITNKDRAVYGDKYYDSYSTINKKLGKLADVFRNKRSFSLISQQVYKLLGMGNENYYGTLGNDDHVFVNCRILSQTKNKQGRLLLFTASEKNIKWSDGLCNILESYGAAIEEVDAVTGLEAFMLAGIGDESDMETVYKLLQDHPAAINPYVVVTK